jgi:cellulase
MRAISITVSALLASQATAHGIVTKIIAGTKTYSGYDPNFQYQPTPPPTVGWTAPSTQDRGPVPPNSYQSPDIICAKGATPAKIAAEVQAGDSVSLQWTQWPDSHKGPMLDYLADCGADCSTVDKMQLKFFKIDGVGMTSTSGVCHAHRDPLNSLKTNIADTAKVCG